MKKIISQAKFYRVAQDPSAELAIIRYKDKENFFKVYQSLQAVKVGNIAYSIIGNNKRTGVIYTKWDLENTHKDFVSCDVLGLANIF